MFEHRRKLSSKNEKLMADYVEHLKTVVGAAKGTIYNRTYSARTFFAIQEKRGRKDIARLGPDDVRDYIMKIAERYERGTLRNVRTALRSLFKYLHIKGLVDEVMIRSVPEMPQWSLAEIPDHMTEAQTEQLLKSFNRNQAEGKRNYAIAMVLVYLGLRAGEVAAMEIDDINWEQGILNVRNLKCRRRDQLPLPKEVGEAIISYLKSGRPESSSKNIFLCHRSNRGNPVHPSTIQGAMTYQFKKHKMRMVRYGTHIIRRTVAGRMIQNGASLKEIADVLRHRDLDTTKIYTKINLPALREVAMEWPWGAAK
jgi:integrase/recombinase XerD